MHMESVVIVQDWLVLLIFAVLGYVAGIGTGMGLCFFFVLKRIFDQVMRILKSIERVDGDKDGKIRV